MKSFFKKRIVKVISAFIGGAAILLILSLLLLNSIMPDVYQDTVLSQCVSPSGKLKATVVQCNAMLAEESNIVFLHSAKRKYRSGETIIAVTNGSAPDVKFLNEKKLQVSLYRGTKHNHIREAMSVYVIYE
jgi:hypothetical protein